MASQQTAPVSGKSVSGRPQGAVPLLVAQGWFAGALAGWFGALFALAVLAVRADLVERLPGAALVGGGALARLVMAGLLGLAGAGLGYWLARLMQRPIRDERARHAGIHSEVSHGEAAWPATPQPAQPQAESGQEGRSPLSLLQRFRKGDGDRDSPLMTRAPIRAHAELGEAGFDGGFDLPAPAATPVFAPAEEPHWLAERLADTLPADTLPVEALPAQTLPAEILPIDVFAAALPPADAAAPIPAAPIISRLPIVEAPIIAAPAADMPAAGPVAAPAQPAAPAADPAPNLANAAAEALRARGDGHCDRIAEAPLSELSSCELIERLALALQTHAQTHAQTPAEQHEARHGQAARQPAQSARSAQLSAILAGLDPMPGFAAAAGANDVAPRGPGSAEAFDEAGADPMATAATLRAAIASLRGVK